MSGGANKEFRQAMRGDLSGKSDPLGYLRKHIFASNPHASTVTLGAGAALFNLFLEAGRMNVRFRPPTTKASTMSHAFRALWLPNSEAKSEFVNLTNDVDYLFTPGFTDCTFEIDAGVVRHHDANMTLPAAVANLRRGGGAGRRKWDKGEFDASIVIGVRGEGGWEFYQQSYHEGHTGQLPDSQVTAI